MDDIFRNTKGWFDVVHLAKPSVTPNRYDKNGNFLTNYLDTEEHRRRSSVAPPTNDSFANEKGTVTNKPRVDQDEAYKIEGGFGDGSSGSSR